VHSCSQTRHLCEAHDRWGVRVWILASDVEFKIQITVQTLPGTQTYIQLNTCLGRPFLTVHELKGLFWGVIRLTLVTRPDIVAASQTAFKLSFNRPDHILPGPGFHGCNKNKTCR